MSITLIIVVITVLFSWQGFNNPAIKQKFMHQPYVESRHNEYYRWITSGFLHADLGHLAVNMFVFYQFGEVVEALYKLHFGATSGSIFFVLMYLTAIVSGDLFSFIKEKDNPYYSALGASGGVSGVLFAYSLFDPWGILKLYGLIPLPMIVWGVLYLAYEQWASKNAKDNVGHDAHFYGAVAGILVTIALDPQIFMSFLNKLLHEVPTMSEIFNS